MSVTVVVVTFESAATLSACLGSIPSGNEVVVIDNASEDASVAIANATGARVVTNASNRGFAAAANQGAALGTGATILFLNPDAVLAPDSLARLQAALDADPELAIVGPGEIRGTDGPLEGFWPFPSAGRTWYQAFALHRMRPRPPAAGFIVGTCMLVRRALFEAAGGFNEAFWLYGEDADLCWRVREAGGCSAEVGGAAIDHAGGHSSAQLNSSFEHFHRGTELFIALHRGRIAVASHRAGVLIDAVIRSVVFARKDPARSRWFRRLARREARLLMRAPLTVPAPPEDRVA